MKNFNLFTATKDMPESTATPKINLHYKSVIKESIITYTRCFFTSEVEEKTTHENEERRQQWYFTLTEKKLMPTIKNNKIQLFLDDNKKQPYELAIEKIQAQILESIEKNFKSLAETDRHTKEQKLLNSLAEICRYIPDLDRPDANFFIDKKTCGIGVTIKRSGTLSLLVHDEGKVEYSLASNAKHGGLFRMTGTAKTTKEVKNSEYIKVLLGLIESN